MGPVGHEQECALQGETETPGSFASYAPWGEQLFYWHCQHDITCLITGPKLMQPNDHGLKPLKLGATINIFKILNWPPSLLLSWSINCQSQLTHLASCFYGFLKIPIFLSQLLSSSIQEYTLPFFYYSKNLTYYLHIIVVLKYYVYLFKHGRNGLTLTSYHAAMVYLYVILFSFYIAPESYLSNSKVRETKSK